MTTPAPLARVQQAAEAVREGAAPETLWTVMEQSLAEVFGHKLFTALVFDADRHLLIRIHSNMLDINPVGGAKSVTKSMWTQRVLYDGRIYVGSNRDDIKSVFSEYETLWSIGCESVLNIPVRRNGVTIGSMNLLDKAGQYDDASHETALIYAELAADALEARLAEARLIPLDEGNLEHV